MFSPAPRQGSVYWETDVHDLLGAASQIRFIVKLQLFFDL